MAYVSVVVFAILLAVLFWVYKGGRREAAREALRYKDRVRDAAVEMGVYYGSHIKIGIVALVLSLFALGALFQTAIEPKGQPAQVGEALRAGISYEILSVTGQDKWLLNAARVAVVQEHWVRPDGVEYTGTPVVVNLPTGHAGDLERLEEVRYFVFYKKGGDLNMWFTVLPPDHVPVKL